jgi:type II secretory pathway component PulJ
MSEEESAVRNHLQELLEALEAGEVVLAKDWLKAAIRHLDGDGRDQWPELLEG